MQGALMFATILLQYFVQLYDFYYAAIATSSIFASIKS